MDEVQAVRMGTDKCPSGKLGPLGRGWQEQFTSVRMVTPDIAMLHAIPRALDARDRWSRPDQSGQSQNRKKRGPGKVPGKLTGMMVLNGDMREIKASVDPLSERYTDKKLEELEQYQIPGDRSMGPYNPEERRQPDGTGQSGNSVFP